MSQMRQARAVQLPGREDLLRAARSQFLRTSRVDISSLAATVGVSRATAYRWAGDAERLTGEVLADIAEATFHRSVAEAAGSGADRIVNAMERGMWLIVESEPYQAFLRRDPQKALRLAASKDGPSQGRMIGLHQALLDEEIAAGRLTLAVDSHTMAYALVRTAESFMYADLIAGETPNISQAVTIIRLLLR